MKKQGQDTRSEEFKNFQELTKHLLAVPKSEVDKKRTAYENRKNAKKEKPAK